MGFDYGYEHEKTASKFFIGLTSNILNMLFVLGLLLVPVLTHI